MLGRILRNILALLTGHVVAKAISLVCVIFLARRFGVETFGAYGTVMAYLTLFASLADNGLNTVTIRDVAQNPARANEYFFHVLLLRGGLTLAAYALMLSLGWLLQPSGFSLTFIGICGLFLFPEGLKKLGVSMLSAYERMDLVALLDVAGIIFRYVPFLLAIVFGHSLQFGFLLLVASWMLVAFIGVLMTRRVCLRSEGIDIHVQTLRNLLYEAFPFGIFFILSVIYFKADILMLSTMQGNVAVGFYEGAYKFIEAAMFIPLSIVNVLLPVMARSVISDKSAYAKAYMHATRLMAIVVLPIVILVSFFSRELIVLIYGEAYLPSASALSLLIWALFLIFVNAPAGNVLATSKLMNAFLPYAIGNTLLNIVLNLVLIPRYSFLGASVTTVLTECTGFALQLWFIHRALGQISELLKVLGKITAAGGLTALVLYGVKSLFVLPVSALIVLGVYVICLFAFRIFDPDDMRIYQACVAFIKAKKS